MSESWIEIWKRQDECANRLAQVTEIYDAAVKEFNSAIEENPIMTDCMNELKKVNFEVSKDLYEKISAATKENDTNKRLVSASNAIHDVQDRYFKVLFEYINMITNDRE